MNKQTILTLIFIIIILLIGYVWYGSSQTQPVTTLEQQNQDLGSRLDQLRHLKDIKLDSSVFQDKFFRSLQSPPVATLPNVKIGRTNPFVPF